MLAGILLQISGGASGNSGILVPDTDRLFYIIVNGIRILLLFFQTVEFHLKIFHVRRSLAHAFRFVILAPVHGSPLILILAGALHSQFLPIVEEGASTGQQIQSIAKLRLCRAVLPGIVACAPPHIMIRVKRGIDVIRIVLCIHSLLRFQILCIGCRGCLAVYHICDDSGLVSEGKIKHAVHATRVILRIGILICPAFTHQIILRVLAMDIIGKPA